MNGYLGYTPIIVSIVDQVAYNFIGVKMML